MFLIRLGFEIFSDVVSCLYGYGLSNKLAELEEQVFQIISAINLIGYNSTYAHRKLEKACPKNSKKFSLRIVGGNTFESF